jgi:hypothetical protein
VGIGVVLGAIGAGLGGRWRLGRRLAGGWNEGAYLLTGGGGSRAVLSGGRATRSGCSAPGALSGQDLLHGNFNLANTIATAGRLWLTDVEGLGAGPRAYDLAEALLAGAEHGHLTGSAAARLWACAAGMDRREFAVCAGSVALTMAESFLRHGRTGGVAGAVPAMVRALERALALAGG